MNPFLVPAGVLAYVAIVIAVAMQVRDPDPRIHTRTVQTIHIDLDDEYERHLQR